jgi:hypothetical protein
MIHMQCPDCGYEADESSIFCPQCRFQFRDIIEEPVHAGDTMIDLPERGVIADERIPEETHAKEIHKALTDRELLQLEVQLIQPAVLIVLIISLFMYTVISTIPFIPITLAGLNFGVPGIICLACGLFSGIVFLFVARRLLAGFRYR